MAILTPLTKLTLEASQKAAKVLSKIKSKDQTKNQQKKEIVQSFHNFFIKQNGRRPQKNEFDRLLSGKGIKFNGAKDYRYSKTKTLVEGLEFGSPQNVTYENFLVKQARGKSNKITDPYHVSAGTLASRKRRATQKALGDNPSFLTKNFSVGPKNYGTISEALPKQFIGPPQIAVKGYENMNLKPSQIHLSHGNRKRKMTPQNLRVAAARLNETEGMHFREAEDALDVITAKQKELVKGKTPIQLKNIRNKVESFNQEKLDIILGKNNNKIARQLDTELYDINNRGVLEIRPTNFGDQRFKIDQYGLLGDDLDPSKLSPKDRALYEFGKRQSLENAVEYEKSLIKDFGKDYKDGGRVGMSIGGLASDKKRSFAGDQFGKNKIGTLESMLAGIGSGLLDIPKGAFTLGAALMDLGFGTSNAAKVENFFDDLTGLDEKAEATFAGNLTKIMVNLGVPGGFAAKAGVNLTKKALLAKKNGNYFKLTDPRLVEKYGTSLNAKGRLYATLGGAGAAGVADGIFVGDPEHVGTIGDMFGGPTQLLENDENSAAREVANRMKFGLDSSLLIGLIGGSGSAIKSLVKRRNELSSNNDAIDKLLGAFRPRGMTPQEFFELNRANIGARAGDINYASQVSRDLDKHIDKIFPYVKNPFNKLGNEGRRSFMSRLNKALLSGDINFDAGAKTVRFGEMNKKNVDEIVAMMRKKGGKAEDIQGVLDAFGDIRGGWGNMFTRLGGVMDDAAFEEFSGAFGKKFSDYLGSTYEVFKNKSLIPMFNFRPSAEAIDKAAKMFRQAADEKGTPITKEEAEYYVSKVVESARAPAAFATKGDRSAGVYFNAPDFFANKSTIADIEKLGLNKTTIPLDNLTDAARPVFDELLGKIDDPMQTILTGTNKLSLVARRNELFQTLKNENATTAIARKEFLDNPDNIGRELPPELRGFFRETELEAMSELGKNIKRIEIDGNRSIEAGITNPLDGLYAEKGVADAIEESAMLARDKGTLTQLYNSFILYPKATSQLAKTVLSPITHARNFISAGAFATANGLIPGLTVSLDDSRAAFKEAFGMIQTNIPGTRQANDRYRDLLRLGVVNSNVRLGDLQKLLNDVNFGETVTGTQQLRNQMRQLSKLKKWTEDMYTAEDDFWKISSFAMERGRLKKAYQKYGMDFTDDLLDNEAANIVRNNIPNYDMVSSFVKSLRQLPFGNFVSFPAEIYRTSFNIMGQIMKEFKFQHALPDGRIVHPFRNIAMKRAMGFGTTVVGVPAATVAGFQALYDVTEDEMKALRRFVPDWSKNSTLVPIRGDDGKLKYVDFSHANAYDAMIRPWTTMFNGIQKGMDEEELGKNLILSMIEATKETALPFVSESIWTSAIADISPILGRNGRTQSGRRLWTDETPIGDKFMESIKHLGATVVPGSIPAIVRMKQAVTEEVDEYGRTYEFLDEALGVAGLRAVQVDPVAAMKFKIADFRTGLNDSRREFTGPLLKGGPITAEQVVDQYQKANQAMFRVQKRMFDDYYAARILGASENQLNNTFQDRISDLQVRHIKAGRFKPFVPSENIQKAFADNAKAINQPDAFRQARDVIRRIMRQYNNKPLGANQLDILDNPFRTSLGTTVTEPFTGLQPLQDLGLTTPTVGNNLNQNTLAKGQAVFGPTDTIFGS